MPETATDESPQPSKIALSSGYTGRGKGVLSAFIQNFAIITTVITLAGSSLAFVLQRQDQLNKDREYKEQEERRLEISADANRRESKRAFLEMQLRTYQETIGVAEKLAIDDLPQTDDKTVALQNRFSQLYYGEMAVVEDERVGATMAILSEALRRDDGSKSKCGSALRDIVFTLSQCMKTSLSKDWGFEQDDRYCTFDKISKYDNLCGLPTAVWPKD